MKKVTITITGTAKSGIGTISAIIHEALTAAGITCTSNKKVFPDLEKRAIAIGKHASASIEINQTKRLGGTCLN